MKGDHPLNSQGQPRAHFGRRSGKRLHKGQDRLFREALPGLSIALGDAPIDPPTLFEGAQRIELEIGTGGGEHLARIAADNPSTGYIGSEVFSGGVAKLLETVVAERLHNIRIFNDDAIKLLLKLPDACLDAAYLLYPDPWPKSRHHKRRFISPTTLKELGRVLKPGTIFRFATDIEDYANWTLAHIVRSPDFRFAPDRPGVWHEPYPGWRPTRYEDKARLAGRMTSFYFEFQRL